MLASRRLSFDSFVKSLLVLSLMIRIAVGAPCCLVMGEQSDTAGAPSKVGMMMAEGHTASHLIDTGSHQSDEQRGHHGGDDSLLDGENACCAACGPVLAADTQPVILQPRYFAAFSAAELAALATAPPPRAYSARAPPSFV